MRNSSPLSNEVPFSPQGVRNETHFRFLEMIILEECRTLETPAALPVSVDIPEFLSRIPDIPEIPAIPLWDLSLAQ